MTPYLVHKTWVDLDHVLAINGEVQTSEYNSTMDRKHYEWWRIEVEMMFRDGPISIPLGETTDIHRAGLGAPRPREILEAFIAAWKCNRSCTQVGD